MSGVRKVIDRMVSGEIGAHAILLYGPEGAGKSALAREITRTWLAKTPGEEDRATAAFDRGNCADYLEIRPQGASSLIVVTQIVESQTEKVEHIPLQVFFETYPLMSRNKVAVLYNIERMNPRAANSLLKTLEEPPPRAKLILITPSLGAVLPTIRSRCVAVACELPSRQELRARFPNATEAEVRLAEGAPERLERVLRHRDAYRRLTDFADGLRTRPREQVLTASEEFLEISEAIAGANEMSARQGHAHALDAMATYLARDSKANPRWTGMIAETHRRVLQNGGAGLLYDALFAQILVG